MKKLLLFSVVVITSLFLTSISHAADTVQEKSSEGDIQRQDVERQDNPLIEIHKGYIIQLKSINSDLLNRHTILAGNYYASKLANARMKLSMEAGTSIPAYVGEVLQTLSTQRVNIDTEINKLEKKKENLKLDVNSFFDGKVPIGLSKEWDEEEKKYTESLNQIHDAMSELIERR